MGDQDQGLREPVKRFDETFSGEGLVLDRIRAARPDLDWFIAPERTYSINDNPNSCRRVAGYIGKFILAVLGTAVVTAIWNTGGL